MITYSFLQHYWWFLVSLLAGLLSFLLFVQGGQTLLFSLGKTEDERRLLVNAIGKKWEFTFTTLVTFGGAFFASFPLFYSTSFGGAYWVWMLILFCFVMQAVSYEYQNKPGNLFGVNTYRGFLFFNGLAGTFLIGAAVATFFTGSLFSVNKMNITESIAPVISQWESPLHGLEALFDVRNWLLGLAVFFLARTLGILFFKNRINYEELEKRFTKALLVNAIPFVIFFLAFVIWILFGKGFAVNPDTKAVTLESMKYFNNLLQMPIVLVVFLIGVVLVLYGIIVSYLKPEWRKGIWFSGVGTVLTVTMLLLLAGYNNTAYYPSTFGDMSSSLTIANSSSSEFTLTAMSIVSLIIPIVLVYIFFAWRSLEKKRITLDEINDKDSHAY
ncbi:Cytochrome bd quinol oxidase subunit 2 apoprotein [uncultured Paludibacter sp.]|uniref:Cytochrome bd quinol oxidase subunit 2 apoprotein n=1 Tax=uncultured Paludibacter sp. TaxID=497635 RepID=A0A653ACU3_9BACT|nr:Cytochrome bd quinol oxidase subunit 2 apoprotein [uncultured Paludibacter sp.]